MDTICGQDDAIKFLRLNISNPPHIILFGPTGIGKTMLAHAWIQEHLNYQGIPATDKSSMILQLNSTEDRGIAVVRQRLSEFVRNTRKHCGSVAWVLIDDAENLPVATQQALRRILEINYKNARFCFILNDLNNIIEPLQSRCVLINLKRIEEANECGGDYRQWLFKQKFPSLYRPLSSVNLDPLIAAIVVKDINLVTKHLLDLWNKGFSFEDTLSMIEDAIPYDLLSLCGECHIAQIRGQTTVFDLIAEFMKIN